MLNLKFKFKYCKQMWNLDAFIHKDHYRWAAIRIFAKLTARSGLQSNSLPLPSEAWPRLVCPMLAVSVEVMSPSTGHWPGWAELSVTRRVFVCKYRGLLRPAYRPAFVCGTHTALATPRQTAPCSRSLHASCRVMPTPRARLAVSRQILNSVLRRQVQHWRYCAA